MDIEINLGSVIAFLFMGWSIAGIPSLFYMLLMEREITRGAHPNTWQHIFSSCLLGVLAGVALASFFSITHAYGGPNEWLGTPEFWLIVTADGLWTGFVMGLLIKGLTYWGERRSRLATGQTGIGP